ncbi:hypothetical protein CEUSTIGMA_g3724.t1 [Chlamydomonas eustigma]|uniref:START domain-containing protein n=1 Tax=Chlamydomonas eustigma TaxID=1157962 RepID=A0A250X004_9CHLO|nr:hypothetical protein CEUSTIGMA_g3724.t1 [Chlamydomonas eustigma]|eukprot:GAX76279.1 hypothetical protein CEUSTIGMA_g3724.t1 [Chlamydomonas eustigma]
MTSVRPDGESNKNSPAFLLRESQSFKGAGKTLESPDSPDSSATFTLSPFSHLARLKTSYSDSSLSEADESLADVPFKILKQRKSRCSSGMCLLAQPLTNSKLARHAESTAGTWLESFIAHLQHLTLSLYALATSAALCFLTAWLLLLLTFKQCKSSTLRKAQTAAAIPELTAPSATVLQGPARPSWFSKITLSADLLTQHLSRLAAHRMQVALTDILESSLGSLALLNAYQDASRLDHDQSYLMQMPSVQLAASQPTQAPASCWVLLKDFLLYTAACFFWMFSLLVKLLLSPGKLAVLEAAREKRRRERLRGRAVRLLENLERQQHQLRRVLKYQKGGNLLNGQQQKQVAAMQPVNALNARSALDHAMSPELLEGPSGYQAASAASLNSWPLRWLDDIIEEEGEEEEEGIKEGLGPETDCLPWYITHEDLEFFLNQVVYEHDNMSGGTEDDQVSAVRKVGAVPLGLDCSLASPESRVHDLAGDHATSPGPWEVVMMKDRPGKLRYTAFRRTVPKGPTEYKTVTIAADCHPEEFMDFLLDDGLRQQWEGMLVKVELLEQGDPQAREQVVRWVRRLPLHCLADRDYIIARRSFCLKPNAAVADGYMPPGSLELFGITKALQPASGFQVDVTRGAIRVPLMYSMWRCRVVPNPWAVGEVATETLLLHCEDIKVPERLARISIKMGMDGYVRKMGRAIRAFIRERRSRNIAPHQHDPMRYCGSLLLHSGAPASLLAVHSRRHLLSRHDHEEDQHRRSSGCVDERIHVCEASYCGIDVPPPSPEPPVSASSASQWQCLWTWKREGQHPAPPGPSSLVSCNQLHCTPNGPDNFDEQNDVEDGVLRAGSHPAEVFTSTGSQADGLQRDGLNVYDHLMHHHIASDWTAHCSHFSSSALSRAQHRAHHQVW